MPTPLDELIRQAAARLPAPTRNATTRARRAALAALDGGSRRRRSGGRVSLLAAAAVLLAAGATAGFLLAPSGRTARGAPVLPAGPGFVPANGWNTIATTRPRVAVAVAANVELLDAAVPLVWPQRTLEQLPNDGIVLVATLRPKDELRLLEARPSLPLDLRDATMATERGLTRYSVRGARAGYDIDVDVYFAEPPSAPLLAEAQAELGRLAVPPITIFARPSIVPSPISPQFEPVLLGGSIASRGTPETVTVQANECTFPGWRDIVSETTDDGEWRARVPVATKTAFRAKWKTAVSATVTVQTRPGVNLEQLGRRTWSIRVLAQRSFLDRRARLQRFDVRTGRWKTVKLVRLTEKQRTRGVGVWTYGTARALVRSGSQLRAYVPRQIVGPCYLAGYSIIITAR